MARRIWQVQIRTQRQEGEKTDEGFGVYSGWRGEDVEGLREDGGARAERDGLVVIVRHEMQPQPGTGVGVGAEVGE